LEPRTVYCAWMLLHVWLVDLPGAPSAPEVSDVTSTSCHLTWTSSRSDGGTPVTGYVIERRTDVGGRWIPLKTKPTATNELDVTDLFEGQKYEFRVIAENKVGAGKPGEPSVPIVAKSPFSKYMTNDSLIMFAGQKCLVNIHQLMTTAS